MPTRLIRSNHRNVNGLLAGPLGTIVVASVLCLVPARAPAALVTHGYVITDTTTGLDWLHLSQTINRSYNDVIAEMNPGGLFDGWRYATTEELGGLWDAAGGNDGGVNYDLGWNTLNPKLWWTVSQFWGTTHPTRTEIDVLAADNVNNFNQYHFISLLRDDGDVWTLISMNSNVALEDATAYNWAASALVRGSAIPEPATAAMILTALAGLPRRRRSRSSNARA